MTPASTLASSIRYQGKDGSVSWEGRHVTDAKSFVGFLRDVVRPRVADDASSFQPDIRRLATTGMATEFVERLLSALPTPHGWEIGEALAECALVSDSGREVYWPWNTVRDRRTPRASLPGADLVGFFLRDNAVFLLFGEVKTSSDAHAPPKVMCGASGMTWQLEESAKRLDIMQSLLKWLHARCRTVLYRSFFEEAVKRFLASGGSDLVIVGVLVRDTAPSEADLRSSGIALSTKIASPTRVDLIAWYLPALVADWAQLLREDAP